MLKLGFCGDDCNVCPRYIATQNGDVEQLRKVAVLWHKVGYRDRILPPEELICRGCSSTMCYKADRLALRECASEKGVENCGKCESYPCEIALNVFEEVRKAAKNIREKCVKKDYEVLRKAFLSKKENLDRVNRKWRSQVKGTSLT